MNEHAYALCVMGFGLSCFGLGYISGWLRGSVSGYLKAKERR